MTLPGPDNRIEAEMASRTLVQLKTALRKQVDGVVQALPQREVLEQSEAITEHIIRSAAFEKANCVGIYASFPEHEASTVDLARHTFKKGKQSLRPQTV